MINTLKERVTISRLMAAISGIQDLIPLGNEDMYADVCKGFTIISIFCDVGSMLMSNN